MLVTWKMHSEKLGAYLGRLFFLGFWYSGLLGFVRALALPLLSCIGFLTGAVLCDPESLAASSLYFFIKSPNFCFRNAGGMRLTRNSTRVLSPSACVLYCARSLRARTVTIDSMSKRKCIVYKSALTLFLEIIQYSLLLRQRDSFGGILHRTSGCRGTRWTRMVWSHCLWLWSRKTGGICWYYWFRHGWFSFGSSGRHFLLNLCDCNSKKMRVNILCKVEMLAIQNYSCDVVSTSKLKSWWGWLFTFKNRKWLGRRAVPRLAARSFPQLRQPYKTSTTSYCQQLRNNILQQRALSINYTFPEIIIQPPGRTSRWCSRQRW